MTFQSHSDSVLYITYSPQGIHSAHAYQYEALKGRTISLFKRTLLTKLPSRKFSVIISEGWRPSIYASLFKKLGVMAVHINITFGDFLKLPERYPWAKGLVKKICDNIDIFVANSTLTYERLLRVLDVDKDRVFVSWPIIVDNKRAMLKNIKPLFNNKLTICHMSRLRDEDGPDNLIRIYEKLRSELGNNVYMYIIGRPIERKYKKLYNKLLHYSRKKKKFKVLGHLPYTIVCKIFRKCCFFIYPANLKSFGLPVIEAMAAGLIPVVTKTTGARDFVYAVDKRLIVSRIEDMVKVLLELYTYKASELSEWSKRAKEIALAWNKERAKIHYITRLRRALKNIKA